VGEVTTASIATTPHNTAPTTFRSISGFALPSMHHHNSPLLLRPIFETSATALCGTTGVILNIYIYIYIYIYIHLYKYACMYIMYTHIMALHVYRHVMASIRTCTQAHHANIFMHNSCKYTRRTNLLEQPWSCYAKHVQGALCNTQLVIDLGNNIPIRDHWYCRILYGHLVP